MICPDHGFVETEREMRGVWVVATCGECGRGLKRIAHAAEAA